MNLRDELLKWFVENGRSFSWRKSTTPYVVLVTEILLKKTTAGAVERFLPEFLAQFPDPFSLTECSVEELRDFLAPLGLSMQRAIQLKSLAGELIRNYGGQVPSQLSELLELSGGGPYSASAVRCYAFGQIEAPVDTNVARIIVRFHGISPSRYESRKSPEVWELAREFVGQDTKTVREINWALLDLGAQICTARKPKCSMCPLIGRCRFARDRKVRVN